MPVQKFRSLEEMDRAPVIVAVGEALDRFIRHCARFRRFAPRDRPRGVFRFHSLEEAQAFRERLLQTVAVPDSPAAPPGRDVR